jgi:hypothetical protein
VPSFDIFFSAASFAGDVLHHEEERIAVLADFKDLADVGMIERGHRHRLAPQALARTRVGRRLGRQQLDGDATIETRIVGEIDFAHGSRAHGGQNLVGTEARARCQTGQTGRILARTAFRLRRRLESSRCKGDL